MRSMMGRAYPPPHPPWGQSCLLRREGSHLALVVEHPLAPAGRHVGEAVALVEAPRAGVALVDVDLEQPRPAPAHLLARPPDQRGAEAPAAEVRVHIQLVEEGDR